MEWIKTVLNAVRVAVNGVSANLDRLKIKVANLEEGIKKWVESLDWIPVAEKGQEVILAEVYVENPSSTPEVEALKMPVVGFTYNVSFNGTMYDCDAYLYDFYGTEVTAIGAPLDDELEATDETIPFTFLFVEQDGKVGALLSTGEKNVTVSINRAIDNSNTIPYSFLPEQLIIQLAEKVGRQDPVFKGTFSQNRKKNTTIGKNSHAEGYGNEASGNSSHAEGQTTLANGAESHAEGFQTKAVGDESHAEGMSTKADNACSHAEGCETTASGINSHSEGYKSTASGDSAHAEGEGTTAKGSSSHAEGAYTSASGKYSHAEGKLTTAKGDYSHVEGRSNIEDTENKYAHIVGNGTADSKRSNAHTLSWAGVPWFQGRPQFGGTAQDDGSQSVVANGDKEFILASSTEGSTKKFKVTVDDSGALTATEITA